MDPQNKNILIKKKRAVLDRALSFKDACLAVKEAAEQKAHVIVISLNTAFTAQQEKQLLALAASLHIEVERGGFDISLLVPRNLFSFHKELFRMENGIRKKDHHFCPSSDKTQAVIKKEAEQYFSKYSTTKVFHLLPDKDCETVWCSCPDCRAFNSKEQNLIAVCTAASVLEKINPAAVIFYYDNFEDNEEYASGIKPRGNMIRLKELPAC